MLWYGPDGELDTWPHDDGELKDTIMRCKGLRQRDEPECASTFQFLPQSFHYTEEFCFHIEKIWNYRQKSSALCLALFFLLLNSFFNSMVSANPKTENRATKLVINEKSRSLSFIKRKPTLKKKARELATLCDVSVSMICYGPDGELDTWPHNHEDLKDVILQYKAQRERGEPIQNFNLEGFLESKKKKFEAKKTRATKRLCSWDEKLNDFSNEKLMSLGAYLDSKIQSLKERRELLSMDNKEEAIQACVGHDRDDPVDFSVKSGNSDIEPEFDQLLAQILEYNPTLFNDGATIADDGALLGI